MLPTAANRRLVAKVERDVLRRQLFAGAKHLRPGTTGPVAELTALLTTAPATLSADAAALISANPSDIAFADDAAEAGGRSGRPR